MKLKVKHLINDLNLEIIAGNKGLEGNPILVEMYLDQA